MENPKREEILAILKTNTRIKILEIAEVVEYPPKEVLKCVVALINDRWCSGYIEGGYNGVFIAGFEHASGDFLSGLPGGRGAQVIVHGDLFNQSPNAHGGDRNQAGRDVITGSNNIVCERIVPFELSTPPEIMNTLNKLVSVYKESESERTGTLEEIDKLEAEKMDLRRKLNKTSEEKDRLTLVLDKIDELSGKLDNIETKMTKEHDQLREQLTESAAKTVDALTAELEKQNAKTATKLVTDNKELFQLVEKVTTTFKSKLEVPKQELAKIASLLDLNEQNLQSLVKVFDGQPEDNKQNLQNQIVSILKDKIADVTKNPQEIINLLSNVFDQKAEPTGRLASLRSFFSKSKKWLDTHPQAVAVLRTLFFGAVGVITGQAVQIPVT